MNGKLLYKDEEIKVDGNSYVECSTFIKQIIIPSITKDVELLKDLQDLEVVSYSKNASIKESVDALLQKIKTKPAVIVVSFGPHIQKMLTIVEILKGLKLDFKLHQFNKLDLLVNVLPGRNELLDKRSNIPILIILFSRGDIKQISGFSKQS